MHAEEQMNKPPMPFPPHHQQQHKDGPIFGPSGNPDEKMLRPPMNSGASRMNPMSAPGNPQQQNFESNVENLAMLLQQKQQQQQLFGGNPAALQQLQQQQLQIIQQQQQVLKQQQESGGMNNPQHSGMFMQKDGEGKPVEPQQVLCRGLHFRGF